MKKNEFVLYGLSNYGNIIDQVINELNFMQNSFDIKLMLTEALTNAFKHGNKGNEKKPIYLRYYLDEKSIKFEIQDCGEGYEDFTIPNEIVDEDLLNCSGRGLFLIKCLADKIELKNNILIIEKQIVSI